MENINNIKQYKEIKRWVKTNAPQLKEWGAERTLNAYNEQVKDFEGQFGTTREALVVMKHNPQVWEHWKLNGIYSQYEYLLNVYKAKVHKHNYPSGKDASYLENEERWIKFTREI